MALGWERAGRGLYFLYNFFCHQLPERSWFLFGEQFSYTKEQIATAFCQYPTEQAWVPFQLGFNPAQIMAACDYNPLELISTEIVRRQFIGTPELGWKIAWSDRMVGMYASIFLFGLIYAGLRERGFNIPGLTWWLFLIFIAPLGIDGTTHLINDVFRLGFRDTNTWAAMLTGHAFPASFYAGDMFGSLNSVLRIVSGLLFGFGVVGFLWPIMDDEFSPQR